MLVSLIPKCSIMNYLRFHLGIIYGIGKFGLFNLLASWLFSLAFKYFLPFGIFLCLAFWPLGFYFFSLLAYFFCSLVFFWHFLHFGIMRLKSRQHLRSKLPKPRQLGFVMMPSFFSQDVKMPIMPKMP